MKRQQGSWRVTIWGEISENELIGLFRVPKG